MQPVQHATERAACDRLLRSTSPATASVPDDELGSRRRAVRFSESRGRRDALQVSEGARREHQ